MRNKTIIPKTIGVIISTYNNPLWLEMVLWGYYYQTYKDFEIIVADDGSTIETSKLIQKFYEITNLRIKHIWQKDNGFQKCRILNKAIVAAESEYLVFTDQDCIPRQDFIETHLSFAEEGYFLSGGKFMLPISIGKALTKSDIENQAVFSLKWLKEKGLRMNFKCTKLWSSKFYAKFLNFITPAKATWNGCNSSGWKSDFLAINGFNEEMQYGGEDREFGERLSNYHIKSKQIRYSAICLHLEHKRPYKSKEIIETNKAIRKQTRNKNLIMTSNGIRKIFKD